MSNMDAIHEKADKLIGQVQEARLELNLLTMELRNILYAMNPKIIKEMMFNEASRCRGCSTDQDEHYADCILENAIARSKNGLGATNDP